MTRRIGVYGGTFNPPHMGHVRAAEAFLGAMALDTLMIIPSCLPPHKALDTSASEADRLRMTQLAFSHIERAVISDMEMQRGGRSYTADTLSLLKREGRELYLLVGTDMLLTLDSWYKPEVIFDLAHICYIRRECDSAADAALRQKAAEYERRFGARVHRIDMPPLPMSSSDIRAGRLSEDALPPAVLRYIKERGLYGYDRRIYDA